MFIDLNADLSVRLPCQCVVIFHGNGRRHKLTGFVCGSTHGRLTLEAFEKHRDQCLKAAKRWRASKMEQIEGDEPPTPDPELPQ